MAATRAAWAYFGPRGTPQRRGRGHGQLLHWADGHQAVAFRPQTGASASGSSGCCSSMRPSPAVIFLNSPRLTET